MIRSLVFSALFLVALPAQGQIQVDLTFKRLQYIAFEPVIATVRITNMAGRDILLRDANDQPWHGFEVTTTEGRILAPLKEASESPLKIAAGTSVTRKINLMPLFPISDRGVYHVRANVFFADLNKFFYAPAKVFEVTTARPIWERTVGDPSAGGVRTYSLMKNRFPDHTSLYVRVEDKQNSLVYSTFSLGRVISFDEPQAELDCRNQLHVLRCSAPHVWSYSVIGLDGRLLKHTNYSEAPSSPHLRRAADGTVAVVGGKVDTSVASTAFGKPATRLSDRPADIPSED